MDMNVTPITAVYFCPFLVRQCHFKHRVIYANNENDAEDDVFCPILTRVYAHLKSGSLISKTFSAQLESGSHLSYIELVKGSSKKPPKRDGNQRAENDRPRPEKTGSGA